MWLTERATDLRDHVPVTLMPISSYPKHSEVGKFDDWRTEARSVEPCRCQMTRREFRRRNVPRACNDIIGALGHEGVVRGSSCDCPAREEGTVQVIARMVGWGARRCCYAAGVMPELLLPRLGSHGQGPLA